VIRLSTITKPSSRFVCALFASFLTATASAADYPAKPIRFIAGAGPGGASDILARALALKLTDRFGRQVIVDNGALVGKSDAGRWLRRRVSGDVLGRPAV